MAANAENPEEAGGSDEPSDDQVTSGGAAAVPMVDGEAHGPVERVTAEVVDTWDPQYATFGQRFVAYLIDLFLMFLVSLPFRAALVGGLSQAGALFGTLLIVLAVHTVYLNGFWVSRGQTPGMRAMRIRVVRASGGGPLDLRTSLARFSPFALALVASLFAWAIWLWMALTVATHPRRQGIQDRLAGTVVIRG